MDLLLNILLGVVVAATPLVFASIGELVTEKSGVLNLGVEGMMVMGAVAAFAGTVGTGSYVLGIMIGAFAGMAMAFLFGVLTLTLMSNQVACGLALTLFGLGLSALIGQSYPASRCRSSARRYPAAVRHSVLGRLLFGQDALVYLSLLLVGGVTWS